MFYLLLRGLDKLFWSDHLCLSQLLSGNLQTCILSGKTFAGERMTSLLEKHALELFKMVFMLHMIFSFPQSKIKELVVTL